MYDKIILKGIVATEDVDTIVLRNYLEECSEGDEVYYKSTAYANLSGVWLEVRGNRVTCKCSVCKLWAKEHTGKLDNSRPMTFGMAVKTIEGLLMRLCLKKEDAWVTYYEIGVTMKMKEEADKYIREVEEAAGRYLWNDANYPEFRQKTTEKSKYYRKVMKIYDKSFEAQEKGRNVGSNVLRVETVYRHQKVPLTELTDRLFMGKMGRIFYEDWSGMCFARELTAKKGVKMSQLERAREIQRIGVTRYKQRYKQLYLERKVTKKHWETMRNFANNWEQEKQHFDEHIGELEKEFKEKLLKGYQAGIFMPKKKKL